MQKNFKITDRRLEQVEDTVAPITVFISPDETEKRYLIDTLKIDEHTLASSMDPDELSRLEIEPDHFAMIYKRPKNYSSEDQFLFKISSVGGFLFKERLILVISEDVPLLEGLSTLRVNSPADMVLRLIYRTIVHFREHLKVIAMISDSLQDKINLAMENKQLINLFTLQKSLVYYLNSINSNGVLIEKLKHNAAKVGFSVEEVELLDDIMIENNQCLRQADIYSSILASLMDARASIVSNNLNVLMKTLNIITIGIMVPTFVVSAFSMNVRIPLEDKPNAFFIIMSLALASVAVVLFLWKFRKW